MKVALFLLLAILATAFAQSQTWLRVFPFRDSRGLQLSVTDSNGKITTFPVVTCSNFSEDYQVGYKGVTPGPLQLLFKDEKGGVLKNSTFRGLPDAKVSIYTVGMLSQMHL